MIFCRVSRQGTTYYMVSENRYAKNQYTITPTGEDAKIEVDRQ